MFDALYPALDWREWRDDWPLASSSSFVHAAGLRWHVQRQGCGPVMLLLHGTGASGHTWRHLIPEWARRFTVVSVDLPGHAFTGLADSAVMNLPGMAQAVQDLMRTLGMNPSVLVGHSDGGTIALLHAAHHAVSACIVMAPHVMVEEISVRSIETAREAFEKGPLRQRLAPFHADVDGAFWQWNDVWLSPAFRNYDIRQEIASIQAPLLAIQGENDAYGTMAQIDDIAAAVPHAQLLKLPQCGHSPHKDQPEAVTLAIDAFLSGSSGQARG